MQKSTRNEDLKRILQLEKTLVYFLNSLKANALVLEKMLTNQAFDWDEEEHERLADALIECRQAVEMGEVFTQIIANMSDIYASMISNNMNMVMKFLTAITLILMAPAIIVGLYGMNVPLPFQDSPWALPIISLGTVAVCLALWRYLLRKHWM
jgi:magnesium transporter